MKNFRWFRSQPFDFQLSINPDAPQAAHDSGAANPVPTLSAHTRKSSISFNGLVLGTAGLSLLALAAIACSREAHKPASTAINVPQPVQQAAPQVTASAPVAALVAPTPDTKPAVKKSAHKRPEKVVYKNDVYGVSFQYPRRYALKTGDEAIIDWFGSQPVGMNFVDGSGVSVAAVELPRGLYPGTDYRDAFFTVSVNRNLSEAQCSQFAVVDRSDSDEEPVAPATVNFGGQVYSQTSAFDGKAFEQAYGRYYHVYNNGACYEMALGLETAGYGAVEGITPVDRDEVFHKLEGMLASVRLRAEEKMPETSVASSPATSEPANTPNSAPASAAAATTPAESEGSH
jgi:hypothetical protein